MTPRRRLLAAAMLLAAATLLAAAAARDPSRGGLGACPTMALFGVHCPGCGTMRALHALFHGDPATAWRFNPAMVLALPLLAWWIAYEVSVLVRGRGLGWPRWEPRPIAYPLSAIALAAWMLARNLPGLEFLAPPGP